MRGPDSLAPLTAALERLPSPPSRILDLGTGTGAAARLAAERFPEASVAGVDLAERMVEEATRKTDSDRITFRQGDAQRLPFDAASFDLVMLSNMIPFFDELARVIEPEGYVAVAFSGGAGTPIYVPPERLRAGLVRAGFEEFAELSAGRGSVVLATKR
jgi:ubiquinone/menaquinone biosynthesis C-methylase UbiE